MDGGSILILQTIRRNGIRYNTVVGLKVLED